MEFERALFRVYDRSLESLRADQPCFTGSNLRPMSICRFVEGCFISIIVLCFLLLGVVHTNYVGDNAPLCLHSELKYQKELLMSTWIPPDDHLNATSPDFPILGKNTILQIGIGKRGTKERLKRLKNATNLNGTGDGEFKKVYRFAENAPLLYLNDAFIKNHNVQVRTLSRSFLLYFHSHIVLLERSF